MVVIYRLDMKQASQLWQNKTVLNNQVFPLLILDVFMFCNMTFRW